MTSSPSMSTTGPATSDRWTLIASSALAYITAVGLHEHLGHAVTCSLLGSHPTELGAFYINCDNSGLSDLRLRLVALAGPVVSLAIGVVAFLVLRCRPPRKSNAYFFVWLLGCLGLMAATGYLFFSGVTGIGDFGTGRDGVFYQMSPEWLWQIMLTVIGIASYLLIVRLALREIEPHLSGVGRPRIRAASRLVLTSYLTGVVVRPRDWAAQPAGGDPCGNISGSLQLRRGLCFAMDDAVVGSRAAGRGARVNRSAQLAVDCVGGRRHARLCPGLWTDPALLATRHEPTGVDGAASPRQCPSPTCAATAPTIQVRSAAEWLLSPV